jgi:ABC-type uncharacterized transport system substrate-binding protein
VTLLSVKLAQVSEERLSQSFKDMVQQRAEGILVGAAGDFLAYHVLICGLATEHRLPSLYPYRDYIDAGGLMAYAPDLGELAQRMAEDVRQILGGARAGDLPIYQSSRFELIINQKVAREVGLTLPPLLLARADELRD